MASHKEIDRIPDLHSSDDFRKSARFPFSCSAERPCFTECCADEQEAAEDFEKITGHKYFQTGHCLDSIHSRTFLIALYDLELFRRLVIETSIARRFELDEEEWERCGREDSALLRLGMRWLKLFLDQLPSSDSPGRKGLQS